MNSNTLLLRFLPIRYERLLAEKLLHHYNNVYAVLWAIIS